MLWLRENLLDTWECVEEIWLGFSIPRKNMSEVTQYGIAALKKISICQRLIMGKELFQTL